MVCGVDLAGEVEESSDPAWSAGDQVIVTGFGLGEDHWGGYAELARVRPEWIVRVPAGRDARWAMSVGTAGLTAMLCVLALERHDLTPEAAGGPPDRGHRSGRRSRQRCGRAPRRAGLQGCGRERPPGARGVSAPPGCCRGGTPRRARRCSAVAPSTGSGGSGAWTPSAARRSPPCLRQTRYGGCVAACGLAGGADLPTTVHPFILRGVTLAGVESVQAPLPLRARAWERLAIGLPLDLLVEMTAVEPLERVPELAEEILAGRTRGRVVIDVGS